MSLLADTLGAIVIPRARTCHTLCSRARSKPELVSERVSLSSSTPPVTTPSSHPTEPAHQRHSPLYRYPLNVTTVAKSYLRCFCWDFEGTYVDLVECKR